MQGGWIIRICGFVLATQIAQGQEDQLVRLAALSGYGGHGLGGLAAGIAKGYKGGDGLGRRLLYPSTISPVLFADARIVAPGGYAPETIFLAIGVSRSRWMARFTGRAPYAGS